MALREQPVELPDLQPVPGRPFGVYVHVPFCVTRCGYCDFNTYTPAELGGVNPDAWLAALRHELPGRVALPENRFTSADTEMHPEESAGHGAGAYASSDTRRPSARLCSAARSTWSAR